MNCQKYRQSVRLSVTVAILLKLRNFQLELELTFVLNAYRKTYMRNQNELSKVMAVCPFFCNGGHFEHRKKHIRIQMK